MGKYWGKQRRRETQSERQTRELLDIFNAICVSVTPEIVNELVARGWNRQKLEDLAAEGWLYCPERNTLILRDYWER